MTLWQDGLFELTVHSWTVFIILLIILWGLFIVRACLIYFLGDALTESELLSLSAAGWFLPVLLLSLLGIGISLFFNTTLACILVFALMVISSIVLFHNRLTAPLLIPFLFLLFLSILVRLAFLKNLVLPSYFDSAEHYRLMQFISQSYQTGILADGLRDTFYHLGFHYMVASISYFFRLNLLEVMLVFGQIVLAILPFPLFFIIKRETSSIPVAILACFLAGFGFHMPAHLMNWGKYPALLSLSAILFVLSLSYMTYRSQRFNRKRLVWLLLGFAALASAFIHLRTLILYALMFISALVTHGWNNSKKSYRVMVFVFLPSLFLLEIYLIYQNPALHALFDGYLKNDGWILMLLLLFAVASYIHYAELTFFLFVWLILCGLGLFIPITIPGYWQQTLLDRPFMQMFVYIPFSLLGGLGLAGIIKTVQRIFPDRNWIQHFVALLVFGLVLLNTSMNYDFYPSDCCRFTSRDDLAAFTWIEQNVPSDAKVLIASASLYVTPFETVDAQMGGDAGIWIAPLLSRKTTLAGQGIQLDVADVHADLCNSGMDYIYVGGMPQSFNSSQLDARPAWYVPVFMLPSARLYQVTGCGG